MQEGSYAPELAIAAAREATAVVGLVGTVGVLSGSCMHLLLSGPTTAGGGAGTARRHKEASKDALVIKRLRKGGSLSARVGVDVKEQLTRGGAYGRIGGLVEKEPEQEEPDCRVGEKRVLELLEELVGGGRVEVG